MEDAVYYGEESVGRHRRQRVTYDTDDDDDSRCRKCCKSCCKCFRSSILTFLIFLATGSGIGVGVVLRYVPPFDHPELIPRIMSYLFIVPELLVRCMTFIVVPLIVCSLVSGVGALHSTSASCKIGLRMMLYYISTSIISVGEGVGFIYAIRPGVRGATPMTTAQTPSTGTITLQEKNKPDAVLDMFRNVIPDNFIKVAFETTYSKSVTQDVDGPNGTVTVEFPVLESTQNMNILGITFFSLMFGVALAKTGSKGRMAYLFFDHMFEVTLTLVKGLMWLYPLSIFFLMLHTVILLKDPVGQLTSILMFLLTVLLGLFTHACLVLPVLFVVFTRRNPFRHLFGCFRALLTGFATNNSNATLPVTMDCLETTGVNKKIIRLMCPIGSTINMDGLALYEAMACIYLATLRGVTLGPVGTVSLAFTAVAVSVGAPAVGGGIATFMILLSTVGLPLQDVFILLPFDWMLARFRTVVNIWGDCVGAGIVEKCSRNDLAGDPGNGCVMMDDSNSLDHGHPDGAVLTGYMPRHHRDHRDWTARLINERGDKLVVSKV